MATVGNLIVKIQAQNQQANAGIEQTRQKMMQMSGAADGAADAGSKLNTVLGSMGAVATAAGLALGGISLGSFLTGAADEAEKFDTAMRRVEAVIKATGGVAGRSADQLREQARQIAWTTLESTEGVLQAQQTLLTFRNVQGEVFDRTIAAAADMTAALGGDLNSATMQLAKALENPTEGLSALSRSGTVFTTAQKDMVKAMVEAGKTAEAQAFILSELEAQYGGTAQAAATGLSGTIDTLGQSVQEMRLAFAEAFGLIETKQSVIESATGAVDALTVNMDRIAAVGVPAVQLLAAAIAGRLVASLGAATAAKVSSIAAAASFAAAERVAAAEAVKAAQAALGQAQANTVLGISSGRAAAAQTALAAAQARYTAATTTATVATRAFSGAMALVGGPVGLAVTAVTALALLAPTMDDGSEATKRLTEEALRGAEALGLLGEQMSNLSLFKTQDALADVEKSLIDQGRAADETRARIAELKRQLDLTLTSAGGDREAAISVGYGADTIREIEEAEGQLSALEAAMVDTEMTGDQLRARLEEIFSSSTKMADATGRASDALSGSGGAADDLTKRYEKMRTVQERVNEVQETYNGLVLKIAESGRSQAEQAELIAQADTERAEALAKINKELRENEAARKYQISDYQKLIGEYDTLQKIENDYLRTMQQIESAELSAIERKRLIAEADRTRIQALQDLKSAEIASLEQRIQGGQDTGAVNMGFINREGEGEDLRSNRTFEEQARALSDRIESGNMTAEGTAQALVGLRGFAEKLGALGEGFDVEGMKGAVDNLAAKALEAFKNGDQKPLTAEEYKKVFEEAQAKAEQKEKDQQASWQSIQNIDAQLEKYLSEDKSPKGSITIKVQKDNGTTEGVVSGDASFLQSLASTLQSVSTAV